VGEFREGYDAQVTRSRVGNPALSTGSGFGSSQSWGSGFYGLQGTLLGDINRDLRADLVALTNTTVEVELASPTGP
jgi:hypothetical protein